MKTKILPFFIFIGSFCFLIISCELKSGYEFSYSFRENGWPAKKIVIFNTDTLIESGNYHLKLTVRYDQKYPFYNLFIKGNIFGQTDSFSLEKPLELILFDPVTGKSLSETNKSIGEKSILLFPELSLEKGEIYQIKMEQLMRQDSLSGILSINTSLHLND